MQRRGPDASGTIRRDRIALGHRRLKIIDLTDWAEQPMVDSNLGLSVVYNGAIYNYRELRSRLEEKGYTFFSNGDTEVLLKGYDAWGESLVEKLQGMFAFAIWDRTRARVFLARDPLGIKPLYLADVPGGVRFASSVPALLAAGDVDTSIDPAGLHHYLTFHSVVPAPRTILKGVRKLPPATWSIIGCDGSRREQRYWRLNFDRADQDENIDLAEASERVLEAMRTAVRRRLIADVPVGVLLSGGVDSSLVVALASEEQLPELRTYSVGFESINGEAGDEFQYSDVVAESFGTNHTKFRVSASRLLGSLDRCIDAMSEPMMSHDAIGFYLLSEEVSKTTKVVQSGQGADEIFAGYYWYPPMIGSEDPVAEYSKQFFDRDHEELLEVVHPRFAEEDYSRRFVEDHFAEPGAREAIDKALRLDTTVMLVDDPVKRVDNMTMAFGLEARVPFLDRDVVELAASMPASVKTGDGGKHVLKEAARKVVPPEVIDRPKGYFPVPPLKHLRGEVLERIRGVLHEPSARKRELFRPEYVDRLLREPDQHFTPLRGAKLWQIAVLEMWLQRHGV